MNEKLGIAHFWAQGDAVSHGVAIALLLMSVASWYIIIGNSIAQLRARAPIARCSRSRSELQKSLS